MSHFQVEKYRTKARNSLCVKWYLAEKDPNGKKPPFGRCKKTHRSEYKDNEATKLAESVFLPTLIGDDSYFIQ